MKNEKLKFIKEYALISIGAFLYCWSWTSFLIPNGISGGGVTGMATVIQYATDGLVPVSFSYLLINAALLIIGTIVLGKGFGVKTIYSIILSSILLKVLPDLIPWSSNIDESFINALLGGAIGGVGIYMIFMQGGSTGGTDIIALVIGKYREVSPGTVFMWCDLIIIGSIAFLPEKGLQDVVYGYIQMVSFTYTLDMLLTGNKQSVQILIFSSKYEEIANTLVHQRDKGVTALSATGWYSKNDTKVLLVVVRKYSLSEVMNTIKEIDDKAFTSVTQVQSVYGQGFDQIKAGGKIKWNKKQKES
ncbi:MAG: YitT family protein [Bacteroidales bacterium]|nr:YitT family protein [Bacteroidales bacterium]